MLEGCLVAGLLSGGCDVKKIGIVPTPVVSFAVRRLAAAAGAMITASHNPPEYNGIKFWDSSGMAYTPKAEAKIEAIYFGKKSKPAAWDRIGGVETIDVLPEFIDEIASSTSLKRSYKVVVDCGNGAGALVTPYVLRKLGCEVITLNSQLDGYFPGRPLEPTPENLKELCKVVKSVGADIGLAHDGDADRIAAVDEKGRVVSWDKLLALVCAYAIRRFGGKVVTTVDASMVVDEYVSAAGGSVVRTRVGDVSVAQTMKAHGAVFGGEPCGAWICGDIRMCPDGPLAGVRILKLIDEAGKSLSELADEVPSYPLVRIKVRCPNEKKAATMKKFGVRSKKEFPEAVDALTIDGIRLSFKDGSWILVRPSGTEPYIRITAEGKTREKAQKNARKASKLLKSLIR
jgi:phosphoglucosamine mutase